MKLSRFIWFSSIFFGAILGLVFIIAGATSNLVGLIIFGLVLMLIAPVLLIICYFKNKRKLNEYLQWLHSKGINSPILLGGIKKVGNPHFNGFMYDNGNKKWGKILDYKIFMCEEIVTYEIHKDNIAITDSAGFSSGKIKNNGKIRGYNMSSSTTKDISNYEVHIQTKNTGSPFVTIPCEKSFNSAQNICSYIRLAVETEK